LDDWQIFPVSVSGVWSSFFDHFDATAVIQKNVHKWRTDPSSKYYAFFKHHFDAGLSCLQAQEQLALTWAVKGREASAKGTRLHRMIELFLNGRADHEEQLPEFDKFVEFLKAEIAPRGWRPYRTEWSIFDEDLMVAGQIDSIWMDPVSSTFHMIDWKRCQSPLDPLDNAKWNRHGKPPLEALIDNAFNHYAVQQNLYAAILQRRYGLKLASVWLCQLHPDIEGYRFLEVPQFEDTALGLLRCNAGVDVSGGMLAVQDDEAARQRHDKKRSDTIAAIKRTPEYMRCSVLLSHGMIRAVPQGSDSADCTISKRSWERGVQKWRHTLRAVADMPVTLHGICLAWALWKFGVPVLPRRDGPFFALADGNELLAPWGLCLLRVSDNRPLPDGQYVAWMPGNLVGHFGVACVTGGCVSVLDAQTEATLDVVGAVFFDLVDAPPGIPASLFVNADDVAGTGGLEDPDDWPNLEEDLMIEAACETERMPQSQTPPSSGMLRSDALPTALAQPAELGGANPGTSVAIADVAEVALADEEAGHEEAANIGERHKRFPGAAASHDNFAKLFRDTQAQAVGALAAVQPRSSVSKWATLGRCAALKKLVKELHPGWPHDFARLMVGALAVYRMRLIDMTVREHVLLLYIVEGDDYMRAHNGVVYFLNDYAAFQPYTGLPPESTFGRVKEFLLQLEGIFRLLPRDLKRTDDELLAAANTIYHECQTVEEVLSKCVDASIFRRGDRKRVPRGRDDNEMDREEMDEAPVHWPVLTAQAISKVSHQLQQELREERTMTYVAEWCSTPSLRVPGIVYKDTAVLYDVGVSNITHNNDPTNLNIYLCIPHNLLDPVLQEATEALDTFYTQTFWANVDVFMCCQAAQALARRGINVDRCFIGVSPGGVGQSLYSSHLAAMYGPLHRYFDPNLFYHDDEIRKQIDALVGAIILTGQEAPETNRRMREDVYKKVMSGDGISGRKPYGVSTRMYELIGWKRIEVNRLMSFTGVSEKNFPSIFRRSFVWRPRARFVEPETMLGAEEKFKANGYFQKNPKLKNFLVSGPAVAAGLRMQHGFELAHSRDACQQMVEAYASLGGDAHLTEDVMRQACGLPERDRRGDTKAGDVIIAQSQGSQDDADSVTIGLRAVAMAIAASCVSKNLEMLSKAMFKYTGLPPNSPNMDREALWSSLVNRGLIDEVTTARTVHGRPKVQTKMALSGIVPLERPACTVQLQELHDRTEFLEYNKQGGTRALNSAVMLAYFEQAALSITASKRGRGKMPAPIRIALEKAQSQRAALQEQERLMALMEKHFDSHTEQKPPAKRLRGKASCIDFVPVTVAYHYTEPDFIRTRLQASFPGAQRFPRRAQNHFVGHTFDFDVSNSIFTALHALVKRLGADIPADVEETLSLCATKRSLIFTDILKCGHAVGKQFLHETLFGGAGDATLANNPFTGRMHALSKWMCWLACTLLPKVAEAKDSEQRSSRSAAASTLYHLYITVEDYWQEAWLEKVSEESFSHVSLHYDGLRVYSQDIGARADALCNVWSKAIEDKTGFRVTIAVKKHHTFVDAIGGVGEPLDTSPLPEWMNANGNCIIAAFHRALPISDEQRHAIEKKDGTASCGSSAFESIRVKRRSYEDVANVLSREIDAVVGLAVRQRGHYLVHSEHKGSGHCVAVLSDGDGLVVYDGNQARRCTAVQLDGCARSSADGSTIVTFRLAEPHHTTDVALAARRYLHGLMAGMRDDFVFDIKCDVDSAIPFESEDADVENEAVIAIGDTLLKLLEAEVKETIAAVSQKKMRAASAVCRCPLCPFRAFGQRRAYLMRHLSRHHTATNQFVCSGTKQMKVVTAMFDNDRFGGAGGGYLRRSAELLCSTVQPHLSSHENHIDKDIRLVFTANGPIYLNLAEIETDPTWRRVRNMYYNRGFAELLRSEVLMCHAKVRALIPRLVISARSAGSELGFLYPSKVACWWPIIEDVFFSPCLRTPASEIAVSD
jgi:hypothetical protein